MTIHDPADSSRARLERLVETHGAAVRAYAARRCPADAVDDVVADTFATAWRRIGDVPAGSELPWLYGVARRILANARRADARRGALTDRLEAWAPGPPRATLPTPTPAEPAAPQDPGSPAPAGPPARPVRSSDANVPGGSGRNRYGGDADLTLPAHRSLGDRTGGH